MGASRVWSLNGTTLPTTPWLLGACWAQKEQLDLEEEVERSGPRSDWVGSCESVTGARVLTWCEHVARFVARGWGLRLCWPLTWEGPKQGVGWPGGGGTHLCDE